MVKVKPTENKSRITVKSNNDTSVFAIKDNLSEYYAKLAERWANSPDMVNGADYSSKYYAEQSKNNANKTEILKNATIGAIDGLDIVIEKAKNDIEQNRNNSIDAINDTCSIALGGMYEKSDEVLTSLKALKAEAENSINNTKTTTISDIEFIADGEKKEIQGLVDDEKEEIKDLANLIKENAQGIASRTSFAMFDTVFKDHILTYEESKGLALQGTYVYKNAIAGSRYGYPDFYNKCLEEFNEAKQTKWVQPVLTGDVTQVEDGEIVCSASSYYALESRQPYCAMDGVKSGTPTTLAEFTLSGTTTGWWQVKFPYKLKITGLKYYAPYSTAEASYIATTGRFYTSSDKSTPIGDELSATTNWEIVNVSNIPADGIVTDTIYFDITNSGGYGGIGEIEITATRVDYAKHANGHIFYDISIKDKIDEIYDTYGTAWYYGVDTENERIFLPRENVINLHGELIENVESDNGWYKLYADGWCEQGYYNIAGGTTLTLLKPYKDTNYTAVATPNAQAGVITGSHCRKVSNSQVNYVASYRTGDSQGSSGVAGSILTYGYTDVIQNVVLEKHLYICVGNTESQSTVTDVLDVTTTENDTTPLFTGQYFDFTPNNVSWVKGGEQKKSGGIYTFTYNELVNVLKGETKYGNLKVVDESKMVSGTDYSLYWKVNQTNQTFIAPTAYGLVVDLQGNKRVLVDKKVATDTDSTWYNLYSDGWCEQGGILQGNEKDTTIQFLRPYKTLPVIHAHVYGYYNQNLLSGTAVYQYITPRAVGLNSFTVYTSAYGTCWQASGYTEIPTVSDYTENANLYFKVANAVQNLELLDAGEVLEAVNNIIPNNSSLIASYSMPDYSAGIDVTFPFTAPTSGVLALSCYKSTTGTHYVYINGISVAGQRNSANSYYTNIGGEFLLNKGDEVTADSAWVYAVNMFYPLKGVK